MSSEWDFIYEKAIKEDGSLFFPERLTKEFLESTRRTMGSFLFANQYQNEILPDGEQPFKKEWIRYYQKLPEVKYTFAFIDPAISQEQNADFTAAVVIDVGLDQNWYVKTAQRFKINPSEIVNLCFKIFDQFSPISIGIEDVAYQKALLYMLAEEMRRRNKVIPVTGINPGTDRTKEMRILSLVPRFEWGRILLAQGLHDLEMEMMQFPRGSHDDLLDALSQVERLVIYPTQKGNENGRPNPADPRFESWYIKHLVKQASQGSDDSL